MTDDQIFKNGSKTYYAASKLFPRAKRADVAKLYSFVRVADDYVDQVPSDEDGFNSLADIWQRAINNKPYRKTLNTAHLNEKVVSNMIEVSEKYSFDQTWVEAFLQSMRWDNEGREYYTISELQEYIYGSAEVIGLMMCRILDVPEKAYPAAQSQGAAMQLINFIRDLAEDNELGRSYLPRQEFLDAGLPGLTKTDAERNPAAFLRFITIQLDRYEMWQRTADDGLNQVPLRYRRAIQVANDGYRYTARKIRNDPFVVFKGSVKPPKWYLMVRSVVRGIS